MEMPSISILNLQTFLPLIVIIILFVVFLFLIITKRIRFPFGYSVLCPVFILRENRLVFSHFLKAKESVEDEKKILETTNGAKILYPNEEYFFIVPSRSIFSSLLSIFSFHTYQRCLFLLLLSPYEYAPIFPSFVVSEDGRKILERVQLTDAEKYIFLKRIEKNVLRNTEKNVLMQYLPLISVVVVGVIILLLIFITLDRLMPAMQQQAAALEKASQQLVEAAKIIASRSVPPSPPPA